MSSSSKTTAFVPRAGRVDGVDVLTAIGDFRVVAGNAFLDRNEERGSEEGSIF